MARIDHEHLKQAVLNIGYIGRDKEDTEIPNAPVGISRVFGTDEARSSISVIDEYFQSCGMKTWVDGADNIHGLLSCGNADAKDVMVASHYDTVKHGGLFDGLLGVVTGAEVAKALGETDLKDAQFNLHVIATNGEEGNVLGGTFGSRALMGLLPLDDEEWIEKAEKLGYSKEALENTILDSSKCETYLEMHIEQGPTLDLRAEQIGVVTGIVGLRRYYVSVAGKQNHAGTTMMVDRDDAMVKAARLIAESNDIAMEIGSNLVETVATLSIYPGAPAVIPGRVDYLLEIRNLDEAVMDEFMNRFMALTARYGDITVRPAVAKAPVKCNEEIQVLMANACGEKGLSYRMMPSGATHDGNAFAVKMPVNMIFVPSKDGISHNPAEWTEWEQCFAGADVFCDVIEKLMRK